MHNKTKIKLRTTALSGFFTGLFLLIPVFSLFSQSRMVRTNCPRMQHQADLWYFGDKAGIDFRSGTATPDITEDVMTAFKASAVMCDSAGTLLFFTNGKKVWDRTFTLMNNASGLDGDLGVTQPCIIIPKADDPTIYFIFTLDIMAWKGGSYTTKGLRYSIIDMKLRNGMGDASVLNLPLLTPACQKLTAVMHKDKRSVWVIAHGWDSNEFYACLVSAKGVQEPVISAAGSIHGGGNEERNSIGYMKTSPDGSKLALAITGNNLIELFSFNNETGMVNATSSYTVTRPNLNPYGIEFSPDSKLLYATAFQTQNPPLSNPSILYQFNLQNGLSNPIVVDSTPGMSVAAMQLATDGRIYLSRTVNIISRKDSVDVIYNPNRPGAGCNYNRLNNIPESRFPLLGRASIFSLPNFIQSYFDLPAFRWDSVCHNDVTRFTIPNKANIDSVRWDFGDGAGSDVTEPLHAYAQPGTYLVKLTEMFNGISYMDSARVTSYALPVIAFPADTILLYSGSEINLHAGGGFQEYLWSTGSTDSIIAVASQGKYRAKVKDFNCCTNADSVFVKVFEYFIPNAFTPNNDGLNDVFKVEGLYKNIKFRMSLYNRWGQMIFESTDIDNGWNGMVNGQYCAPDSFVWIVNIGFLGQDIITQGDIVLKGTVTLVR